MKKIILLSSILLQLNGFSQIVVIDSSANLDINLVKAPVYTGGLVFRTDSAEIINYEYPAGSGNSTIFCSGIWLSGYKNNQLCVAAERYRESGRDYYPGPVMDPSAYPSEVNHWNNTWKINKTEIDSFIANWTVTGYIPPPSITGWPAHGNQLLGQNFTQAPFFDNNSDGYYNPSDGDYPTIRGDQAIYFIFNDSVYPHAESGGPSLGAEIHGMAYAYNSYPLLNKTIFVNYLIYNRSVSTWDSIYVGQFADIDVGDAWDDYIGCDTTMQTYFGYNGRSTDLDYGSNPPVQTITFLRDLMTSFSYYNNTGAGLWALTDPDTDYQYYLNMNSMWKDTSAMVFGGCGHIFCSPSTTPAHYMFPGNPNDTTQWTEPSAGNDPYDRRGVGIIGPFNVTPGDFLSLDIAYSTIDSFYTPKSMSYPNIDNMYHFLPYLHSFYDNNIPQNGVDLALNVEEKNSIPIESVFDIYPNPVSDFCTLSSTKTSGRFKYTLIDISGREQKSGTFFGSYYKLDMSELAAGIYIMQLMNDKQCSYFKLVKN